MADLVQGIVAKISEKSTRNGGTMYNICLNCNDTQQDEWFGHGFDQPIFFEGDEVSFEVEQKGQYYNVVVDTVQIVAECEPQQQQRGGRGNGNSNRSGNRGSGRGGNSGRGSSGRGGNGQRGGGRGNQGGRNQSGGRSNSSGRGGNGGAGRGNNSNAGSGGMNKDEYWANKEARDLEKDAYFKEKDDIIAHQACQNTAIAFVKLALDAGVVALPTKGTKGEKYDALIALVDEEAERLYTKFRDTEEPPFDPEEGEDGQEEEQYDDNIPE